MSDPVPGERCTVCHRMEMYPEMVEELPDGEDELFKYWAMICLYCGARGPGHSQKSEAVRMYVNREDVFRIERSM